jgi:xylulokinase
VSSPSDGLLLGVDIGTSSCKLLVIDESGTIVGTASAAYEPVFPRPGWVEQDPEDWYHALQSALKELRGSGGVQLRRVRAIGVTGQMRGVVLLGAEGRVIRPAILWNDLRNTEEVEEVGRVFRADSGRLARITRNPLNTMCTLPKLLWLIRHEPQAWRATRTLVFPKDFIVFRLTGQLGTDPTDASGTSFFDVRTGRWSEEILDRFGIAPDHLPEVHPTTSIVGSVSVAAAAETGLIAGTPIVRGGSDATVEAYAIGLVGSHQCKVRLGTSGAASTVVDDIDSTASGYCWSYVRPDRWLLDTNTRSCGQAVAWLRRLLYAEEVQDRAGFASLDRDAASAPLGAGGLLFHPYLLGEDAPYWDASLRASISGLRPEHTRRHIARAVLEGTAFAIRDALSVFADLVPAFEEYAFVGGGARSAIWLSIVSDVLGVDGIVPGSADAALGAAMLAGVGTGLFDGLDEAVQRCRRVARTVVHDPANSERYDEQFEAYRLRKLELDSISAMDQGTPPGRVGPPVVKSRSSVGAR